VDKCLINRMMELGFLLVKFKDCLKYCYLLREDCDINVQKCCAKVDYLFYIFALVQRISKIL
jgi:hypothetical protein